MGFIKRGVYAISVIMVFVSFFCTDAHGVTGRNGVYGAWECVVETDNAEDLVFFLFFAEPGDVTYVAGWYQSEVAAAYTGRFTIEGDDVLKLEMSDAESSDTLAGTFSFDVSDGVLLLAKLSGDDLSYVFEAGEPMEFTITADDPFGQMITVE